MDTEIPTSETIARGGALAGVRVLDLSRILSGPYCTLLLTDLGADVIKIEEPTRGDDTRWWGPPFLGDEPGLSTYFGSLNRGKRSVGLDLRAAKDQLLFRRLVERADVVVENFRPETAEALGLSAEALHEVNPRLVLCSISGWGREGAYADWPGTEIVVEAMSGLMSVTGPPDGDPVRFGIAMTDIATGLTAAARTVAGILQAERTGRGSHVECSLYASAIGALGTLLTAHSVTGDEQTRWGSHHPTICPYGGYPTADGHLITGVINDRMWTDFCGAIGLPQLAADSRFETNAARVAHRTALEPMLSAHFATDTLESWLGRLQGAGLLAAPIRTVGAAAEDPATRAMDLFVELAGFPGAISPRLDNAAADGAVQHVPRLGEHTDEVLDELIGRSAPSSTSTPV